MSDPIEQAYDAISKAIENMVYWQLRCEKAEQEISRLNGANDALIEIGHNQAKRIKHLEWLLIDLENGMSGTSLVNYHKIIKDADLGDKQ